MAKETKLTALPYHFGVKAHAGIANREMKLVLTRLVQPWLPKKFF